MENKNKTITLELHNPNLNKSITFKTLYNGMQNEINIFDKRKEELFNQPLIVSLYDANGKAFDGIITDFIGWLENGSVLLVGNLTEVSE